jgi:hypothetical protein
MPDELSFNANRIWWWDPPPPWIWNILKEEVQQEIIKVSVQTQINVLQAQMAGLEKIGKVLEGANLRGAAGAKTAR